MSCSLFASRPRARRTRVIVAAAVSVLAASNLAQSAVLVWNNSAGGTYTTSANWTPLGPPSVVDTARFNLNNSYTVSFTASLGAGVLDVIGGSVGLGASGALRTYNVTSANIHGGDLLLTGASFPFDLGVGNALTINSNSQFTVSQGNDASAGTLNLGTVSGA